jgi:helicase
MADKGSLDGLGLPKEAIRVLEQQGITTLYPPQMEAVPTALSGKSMVLALPTASGKSLVAYLAIVKKFLQGGKALYIVPLRALASEKHEDLRMFESLGMKVGVATGDYDSPGSSLQKYDVVVATSEKADSLLRHRVDWLSELSIIVADEVHLIADPERGPTLEVILARFRQLNPKSQLLALSATIPNSRAIAEWLGAQHFQSDWRPVKLKEGVLFEGVVHFTDNTKLPVGEADEPSFPLVKHVLSGGGQCLIFVNSRKSAEAMARKAAVLTKGAVSEPDRRAMKEAAEALEGDEVERSSMGSRLAECVRSGTAFHHAGLTAEQRKAVEKGFREGRIKILSATPTLAAGINLPARCVIVRDVRRYEAGAGQVFLPVREIKQMAGRAGRPKYDKEGQAVLLAKTEGDFRILFDEYLLGTPEPVESGLGNERSMRVHVLASVATGFSSSVHDLKQFFKSTFYACQHEDYEVEEVVDTALDFLVEEKMIERKGEELRPTPYGKRVSQMYIDPLTAKSLRESLRNGEWKAIAYLVAAAATTDLRRIGMYMRKGDIEWLDREVELVRDQLLVAPPDDPSEYEFFLADFKLACLLQDWINEMPESIVNEKMDNRQGMTEKYDIGPGDIRAKVETSEWIVYAMRELARLFRLDCVDEIDMLLRRIQDGIKEELLELVKLRGVARVRARVLFNAGYTDLAKLAGADLGTLSRLPKIGATVAQSILAQLGLSRDGAPDDGTSRSRSKSGERSDNDSKTSGESVKSLNGSDKGKSYFDD